MRRDSFLRGAFILMIGSLVSRLLGAVYRFILPWLMGGGDEGAYGMALFGLPYSIYSIVLALSTLGIPLAVSKLVSEADAQGSLAQVQRVFRLSLMLLAGLGVVFSLALFGVSPYFVGRVWQNPDAYWSMVALAPAVFFVSIMSAFRGFFQGLQSMTPHAVSQIVEQMVRVLTMFLLVWLLVPRGLAYAAAGATFGATTGAVAGVFYLVWAYMRNRQRLGWDSGGLQSVDARSNVALMKQILVLAIPISISGLIMPLMRFVDAAIVPYRLIMTGYSVVDATISYGYLESYSMPFINVPAIFTTAVAISLVPSVSASMARRDVRAIREKTLAALRVCALVGIPAAAGLWVLSTEIPQLFWRAPEAGPVLASVALVAFLLGLQQVTSAVLQGLGSPVVPMYNFFLGALVKLGFTWFLLGVPVLGVRGAGFGSVLGFTLAVTLNIRSLRRRLGAFDLIQIFWRPAVASAVMFGVVHFSLAPLHRMGGLFVSVAGGAGLGVLTYGVLILVFGGIERQDLEMIPRVGKKLARGLQKLRLLRD